MKSYLLLVASILLETGKNVFSNNFSKKTLQNETDIYKFNTFLYAGSFAVLCCTGGWEVSAFTVVTAVLFAAALWLNQYFFLKALAVGPMGFTSFIQGVSLVIPVIYGAVVWDEKLGLRHILLLALLICALALALDLQKGKLNRKWLVYSLGAMLALGGISVLQSTHQMSAHKGELFAFLRLAFLLAVGINLVGWQMGEKKLPATFRLKGNAITMAAASGAFMGLVHIINLYLSGVMKKVIFFPVVNGGLIFVTLLSGMLFFKEKLGIKQWLGILLGTVALCLIGL
ncbi:MAG: hypothetical protein IJ403_11185 [Oscillospiraceae bacterium]|nr:hypothetical protein [Oscillospiraceae bacterium]